jgi:uncharacterized phage-associated protein
MPKYKALDVAYYIIKYTREMGISITNLKLQKLLFFCQGWHLAIRGIPLFDDHFEAWPKGPAIYDVWNVFKAFGKYPIDISVTDTQLGADEDVIVGVLDTYAAIDQWVLVRMSHGKSWESARGNLPPEAHCRNAIKLELIDLEFCELAVGKKAISADPEDNPDNDMGEHQMVAAGAGDAIPLPLGNDTVGWVVSQSDLDCIDQKLSAVDDSRARKMNIEEMRRRFGLNTVGRA